MNFREYAFVDLVEELDNHLESQVSLICGLTADDVNASPRNYKLIQLPRFREVASGLVSPELAVEKIPILGRAAAKGTLSPGAEISSDILMPAMFATLGYAVCSQNKAVETIIELGLSNKKIAFNFEHYYPYENNIKAGTKGFCARLHLAMGHARRMNVYFFVKPHAVPLTLN